MHSNFRFGWPTWFGSFLATLIWRSQAMHSYFFLGGGGGGASWFGTFGATLIWFSRAMHSDFLFQFGPF